jgi:hypothetical protein
MSKFLILVDYKGNFLTSITDLHHYSSMDVQAICRLLEKYGHSVELHSFGELDFEKDYRNYYVLYQSAEDIGVFYKDYIEDIVYYLGMKGAVLLPGYTYLLAHHNKNFMELMRKNFKNQDLKTIRSQLFGTAQEAISHTKDFPVVIKSAEGSGSRGVHLARDGRELEKIAKQISGVFIVNDLASLKDFLIYKLSMGILHKSQTKYRKYTLYRKKFIVQNYIDGLQGDYKVVYFGGKYYPFYRENREQDFRASGSGKFYDVEDQGEIGILDFSRQLVEEIDFPIINMDIGYDGKQYHLFEFQCIHIGPIGLQRADHWSEYSDGKWVRMAGKSNLEEEFCRSIHEYVRKLEKKNA